MAIQDMKIKIFDFDGVYFKSPKKPEGWKGGWWGKEVSLLPPHVPNIPPKYFFNKMIIEESLKDNSKNFVVTGRIYKFESRIKELVKISGGRVDDFYFCDDRDTKDFKVKIFKELIYKFDPTEFTVWEDNNEEFYQEFLSSYSKNFKVISVKFDKN